MSPPAGGGHTINYDSIKLADLSSESSVYKTTVDFLMSLKKVSSLHIFYMQQLLHSYVASPLHPRSWSRIPSCDRSSRSLRRPKRRLLSRRVFTKASYASWSSSCFSKEYARGWTRGFIDTINVYPPPGRLVTLRSWVQPPLRPSSQKQWYLQCFLHYRAVKPR